MRQQADRKRQVVTALVGLALLVVVGAEYYRYALTTRAAEQERRAQQVQREVADLKAREQRLQPDLPLMERLETTMLDPADAHLHQQLLEQVLAGREQAGAELGSAVIGQAGHLGGAWRHGVAVQLKGRPTEILAFIRYVETGPAAARATGFRLSVPEGGIDLGADGAEPVVSTLNVEYYSRAK